MAHPLDLLFRFDSIAVVGASDAGFGAGFHRALSELGFTGRYYPINPKRTELHGVPAYPDLASLPEVPQAVAIGVRAQLVPDAVRQMADLGVRAGAIISSGFAEVGEAGAALQTEVQQIASDAGIALIGPNCFGVASRVNKCGIYAGGGLGKSRPGNVGVISNSGGMVNEIIGYGTTRLLGFSHVASTGNEAILTAADIVDYYGADPATEVILAILESVRDPDGFRRAAERAAEARKPIIALKLGTSVKGMRAAATHTAALAGSARAYEAFFRQLGIIQVHDLDELIEMAVLLTGARSLLGTRRLDRAAIIEISGGGTELSADLAEDFGLELPDFSPEATAAIQGALSDRVTPANPLDTGSSWNNPDMRGIYPVVLDALALDDGVDVIVSRYNLPPSVPMEPIRERLDELNTTRQAHPGKLYPILGRTADQVLPDFWSAARDEGHIVLLGYGRGLQALARLARYSEFLLRPRTDARSQAAGPDLAGLPAGYLDEVAAKRVLAQAGLPMLPAGLATSADEAVVLASDYGYPVVLKVVSPDIVHKSDAGGVRLDLGGEADVRSAFDAIQSATKQIGARFEGVSVQPMIRGGVELALGASRDPQLGPLIMVGVGGILVEAIDDVAFGIAPLGPSEGLQMLDSLRSQRLLDGYRGMPTVDRAAVATAVAQLGFLMLDNPRIESVDINPLVQSNRGLVGLDARVLLGDRRASTA